MQFCVLIAKVRKVPFPRTPRDRVGCNSLEPKPEPAWSHSCTPRVPPRSFAWRCVSPAPFLVPPWHFPGFLFAFSSLRRRLKYAHTSFWVSNREPTRALGERAVSPPSFTEIPKKSLVFRPGFAMVSSLHESFSRFGFHQRRVRNSSFL